MLPLGGGPTHGFGQWQAAQDVNERQHRHATPKQHELAKKVTLLSVGAKIFLGRFRESKGRAVLAALAVGFIQQADHRQGVQKLPPTMRMQGERIADLAATQFAAGAKQFGDLQVQKPLQQTRVGTPGEQRVEAIVALTRRAERRIDRLGKDGVDNRPLDVRGTVGSSIGRAAFNAPLNRVFRSFESQKATYVLRSQFCYPTDLENQKIYAK